MSRRIRLTPPRRHLAALITVAISSGFLAVMIIAANLLTTSLSAGVTQAYQGADLVVAPEDAGENPDADASAAAPDAPGVKASWPRTDGYLQLQAPGSSAAVFLQEQADPPASVQTLDLTSGRDAAKADEVVLDEAAADHLGVSAGQDVVLPADSRLDAEHEDLTLRVTGIAAGSTSTALGGTPIVHVNSHNERTLAGGGPGSTWLLALEPGADRDATISSLTHQGLEVRSAQDVIDEKTSEVTKGFEALAMVFAVFVVIALVTSAVVITNTFAVTLAQRTRSLALLRTLGSTRRQVAANVLRESALVGFAGAVLGMIGAHLLAQAALAGAAAVGLLDGVLIVPVTLASVIAPLVAGTVLTAIAGLGPVRAATRVAPLQALRPAPPAPARRLGVRGVLSLVAVVLGLLALVGAVGISLAGPSGLGIALGMLGGVVSFAGLLVGLVLVTRPLARLAGAAAARIGGLPARIAGANTSRNPRRSAATVAALLIGTTLMTMMAVGARTTETTLTTELDSRRPIDSVVTAEKLPRAAVEAISEVPGVHSAQATERGDIDVGAKEPMTLYAATPDQVRSTSHRPELADTVTSGTVVLGKERAQSFGLTDGQVLHLPGADGKSHDLRVHVDANLQMSLVSPATLEQLLGSDSSPALLVDFDDVGTAPREGRDALAVVGDIQKAAAENGAPQAEVDASGAEREMYGQILSVMLGITVGLLAVAVLVALVGVANTLSLGVIERTGENALLRALGTTRGQMRAMLAWEGLLLAVIGAVLGIALGSVYGVLGISTVLGGQYPLMITIPWGQIGLVLALALAAGLLASALPGRRAARTQPARALAAADE
ncbi:ABC transporter permease [Brachybacterium endophyticum]|uniref:ABC transporter permease n=1 Tax=Brachybacterium endophyticum TaxID=2182385 RepID=A0A2U2RH23_9MICO|nr:FtsX-like permease family protein [Brachybacterium endophyticum]PWH05173.1 ABC transporter permease [Brachybacterium endophyticum]